MSHSFSTVSRLLGAAVVAIAGFAPLSQAQAQTTLIDFEPASLTGLYFPGDSFTQGNYLMTTFRDFGTVDIAAALGPVAPTGNATQFYFNSNSGSLFINAVDAVPFNLNSFAAAFVPLDPPSLQTTALFALGTTVANTQVFATFAFDTSSTSNFPFALRSAPADFNNLIALEFRACPLFGVAADCSVPTLNNGQFAIDNISITAVPEPGTVLLLTLGVLALGLRQNLIARRNQR